MYKTNSVGKETGVDVSFQEKIFQLVFSNENKNPDKDKNVGTSRRVMSKHKNKMYESRVQSGRRRGVAAPCSRELTGQTAGTWAWTPSDLVLPWSLSLHSPDLNLSPICPIPAHQHWRDLFS